MKSLITIIIITSMAISTMAQDAAITQDAAKSKSAVHIPSHWAQYTVRETIDVPIEQYWNLFFEIPLEDIASVGDYKDLPKIIKTTPVEGQFRVAGDSRRVHFDTGETVLESVIKASAPYSFAYELTEIEIELKRAAHRARGHFRYTLLPDGKTKITWTYGFEQKNFFFKWFINRYIRSTHRFWMKDTLAELKRLTEAMYRK